MKKMFRTTSFFSLIFILNTTACADVDSGLATAHDANVGGFSVTLANNSNKCQLSSSDSIVNLKIPWPCDFHRGPDNEIRIKKFNNELIILVEYSRPHPELPNDCETRIQAVKVTDHSVSASEHTELVAACPPFQWDDKMFIGLFDK